VLEIGILLGAAQTFPLLVLILFTVTLLLISLLFPLLLVLLYPLDLALLVCGCLSISLCLGFGGLGCLFPFYLGVFGGVPRVEDLFTADQ
jgi:hypothetical protein